ncbi:transducin beta-like protein 3 [Prorops nasuta]|uniref:transducin beta-like protein 3 n=1 Tax=Prorops nasuta TaxID=863751 RepID=UPI0034CE5061
MSRNVLKETFDVELKHEPFYTGGNIVWSLNGDHIFCQNEGMVSVVSIVKGSVISVVGKNEETEELDTINCFTLSKDNSFILTHHKSSLFKFWQWADNKLLKIWKSIHKGPVAKLALSSNEYMMASGGSDGCVKLWNLENNSCNYNLKEIQGVVSVLEFHPNKEMHLVFAAADDTKIYGWNVKNGQLVLTLNGHFSKVTSLTFHEDGVHAVSSGRDRVLILWDLSTANSIRVLPVFEGLEGSFIIPEKILFPGYSENSKSIYVAAAGEKGVVKIWEVINGKETYTQSNSLVAPAQEEGGLSITTLLYNHATECFAMVSSDHNIIIHSLNTFENKTQLVGYSDDILDIAYIGPNDNYIVVATNSCDIKLYELSSMNCRLLRGHTDIVLSFATSPVNPYLLISSGKDNSVRVWLMDKVTLNMACIAFGIRHTASVGSIAASQISTKFFVSVSQDSCLKLWELAEDITKLEQGSSLNAVNTVLAHQKEINSVTISPNDKLIATGSQDKTAKLWSAVDLQLLGTFRGHRRGVWCTKFSPIDQVILTSSADCTIKLWSLSELNCLKTFEGHESSVLNAEFICRGMQIITTGGDGLLKLWTIKTSECVCTLDEHKSKVWALAVNRSESHVISGGSDSLLVIWKDVTEEKRAKLLADQEKLVLEEQKLANLLQSDHLKAALKLALKLERPFKVLKIIEGILKKDSDQLTDIIQELKPLYKESLLKCAIAWNTNSKNSEIAQIVLNSLIVELGSGDLQISNLSSTLEELIPYTDRHFKRITRLYQDLHLLAFTVKCMKPYTSSMDIN